MQININKNKRKSNSASLVRIAKKYPITAKGKAKIV
jgi:hypothetical protein